MVFVFFIYGLAFFILGFAIFILPRKDSAFKFAKSLWLIGSFGILHGINEWIDMFIFIHKPEELLALKVIRAFVMPLSFAFLIWFGTKVIAKAKREFAWARCFTFILPAAWACVFIFMKDHFLYGDIWARYLLCFPGAILTAWSLLLQLPDFKDVEFAPVKKGLKISALFFIVYAIAAGTIVPPSAGSFPAAVFNYNWFLGVFGFPVQVLRSACAIIIAIFMWRVLVVFDWETKNKLKVSIKDLEQSQEAALNMMEDLKEAYEKLQVMQDTLIQAEKFNSIGRLASGVAHEVKNPLGIIKQSAEYLKGKLLPLEKNAPEALRMIEENIERADKIIRELLYFSRAAKLEKKPEDINSILENSLVLIQHSPALANIKIIRELGNDLPKVLVDKGRMEQVFINLLLNAVQAMPEGGKLFLRTYRLRLSKPKNGLGASGENYFNSGEDVLVIEIEDTGAGISSDNFKKVFDPFFTTKEPGKGTGLGLSISRNILAMHKGLIEMESREGKGTRVIITLKIIEGGGNE